MTKPMSWVLVAGACALLGTAAQGALIGVTYAQTTPASPAGYVANDIRISFGDQWTSIQLLTPTLAAGDIYQDGVGGNTPPNSAFFPTFPALEYDTFMANGGLTAETTGGVLEVGGAPELGGGSALTFTDWKIDATWGPALGSPVSDRTDYIVARVTLKNTVNSLFQLRVTTIAGQTISNTTVDAPVVDGVMIPEPMSIGMLGTSVLVLLLVRGRRPKSK